MVRGSGSFLLTVWRGLGRAVADLMGLGFDMIRRLSENAASRAGYRLGGLADASIKSA